VNKWIFPNRVGRRAWIRATLATLVLMAVTLVNASGAADLTNVLGIQSISVNGTPLPIPKSGSINLGTYPENIVFGFGPATNAAQPPLRLRYLLEGHENTWHEGGAEMALTVRFYNASGDQISQNIYSIHGESTGWTGSLKTSTLTHRRETLIVPAQAERLLVVISSAGPPETVGIYVVANLTISKSFDRAGNIVLLRSPFENDREGTTDDPPVNWMHDGMRPSMAKIVKFGQEPQTRAFAILDEDRSTHGEWHNILESAPRVTPGESLVVEWNEMYSMGSGNVRSAGYAALPAGQYIFRVRGLDVMGMLTGAEASISVLVPQPFWKMPWFWGLAVIVISAAMVGISRYFVWHRMRREMIRLKHQRALEQERLRIAHDIHDDLGARVTQISRLSAMAHDNATFPGKGARGF
jgi:hypothetical protein